MPHDRPSPMDEMEIMTRRWLARHRESLDEINRLAMRRRRRAGPLAPLEAWSDVFDVALRRLSQDIGAQIDMAIRLSESRKRSGGVVAGGQRARTQRTPGGTSTDGSPH